MGYANRCIPPPPSVLFFQGMQGPPGPPGPVGPPGVYGPFSVQNQIIGPSGGGADNLDGLDASPFGLGSVVQFTLGGIGAGAAQQYQLTTSNASTDGVYVLAALNVPSCRWIKIS